MAADKKVHITKAIGIIDEWLTNRICQIYCSQSGSLVPEGTGFLIEIAKRKLLVTAGHVAMNNNFNYLYCPNRKTSGFTQITGYLNSSSQIQNLGNDSDDFVYIMLDYETVANLLEEGYVFSNEMEIDFEHLPSENEFYTILGFRSNKVQKNGIDRYVRKEIITKKGLSKSFYKVEQNPENKILIINGRKSRIVSSGEIALTGNLKGMSGGPIWNTSLSHYYHPENPTVKLVGIQHTFEPEKIVGTNISRLLELLERRNQI